MAYVSWESRSGSRAARAYDDSRLRAVRQQTPCRVRSVAEGQETQEGEVVSRFWFTLDRVPGVSYREVKFGFQGLGFVSVFYRSKS